ncbi:MAG TPA: hypothetical protein PKK40_02635 [Marmoricola sp.]|nr:hypothetical protein [Marmoricola sp.]
MLTSPEPTNFAMALRNGNWGAPMELPAHQPVTVWLNPADSHALVRLEPPINGVPAELTSDQIDGLAVALDGTVLARVDRGVVERAQLDPTAGHQTWELTLSGPQGRLCLYSTDDQLPTGADCDELVNRMHVGPR